MQKKWNSIRLEFKTSPTSEDWETFTAMLGTCLSIEGIQEGESPEGTTWDDQIKDVRIFFSQPDEEHPIRLQDAEEVIRDFAQRFLPGAEFTTEQEEFPDQDWGQNWKEYFHLMRIADQLYVGPPWESDLPPDAPEGARVIQIEPGQAFGTGSHETTQLCLQSLEKLDLEGKTVFDLGAGSGILGIGAIFLGAKSIIAVEYDPVCEENFYINADLNGTRDRMTFICTDKPSEARQIAADKGINAPDLILCNMLSERFYPLLNQLRAFNIPLLLSGFLVSEEKQVLSALEREDFQVQEKYDLVEWMAFHCVPRQG